MNSRLIAAIGLALALSCGQRTDEATSTNAAAPAKPAPPRDAPERGNLLNIAYGASTVSRTAELMLDQSALRPIDGDPYSSWTAPPNDSTNQTIVYSLPARTRIEKVGLKTPRPDVFRVTGVQFDSSLDGKTFAPLATVKVAPEDTVQLFPVTPVEAQYIRVTVTEAAGRYAKLESVQVHGTPQEPAKLQPIAGCWMVNGFSSSFTEAGGRVNGVIGSRNPISFEGGAEGAVYRFVWVAGPDWGFGAITISPDDQHLSGLRWYIEPIEFAAADAWFGDRASCGNVPKSVDAASTFLQRAKRLPLYGLHFDAAGSVDEAASSSTLDMLTNVARQPSSQRFALVSREYRQANAAENQRRAKTRLDSLRSVLQKRGIDPSRFEWRVPGSESPVRAIENEIQRVLYGVVELQLL